MLISFLLTAWISSQPTQAEVSRCERIRAEAAELEKMQSHSCEESRETHKTYVSSFSELQGICKDLEARASGGPPQLALGTVDEMQAQAMQLKQKHITERKDLFERVTRELLPTPLDNNDPSRILPKVSGDCGSEVESYARYRRTVLQAINDFFGKIDGYDDSLFFQAQERGLPKPIAEKKRDVR